MGANGSFVNPMNEINIIESNSDKMNVILILYKILSVSQQYITFVSKVTVYCFRQSFWCILKKKGKNVEIRSYKLLIIYLFLAYLKLRLSLTN